MLKKQGYYSPAFYFPQVLTVYRYGATILQIISQVKKVKTVIHLIIIIALLVCGTGVYSACGSTRNDEEDSSKPDYDKIVELMQELEKASQAQNDEETSSRPDIEIWNEIKKELEKGSEKLSNHLKLLIAAERGGTVDEFVRQRGSHIEYEDGKVTVVIECEPGQAEAVAEKVKDYGIVELVISRGVQAAVPISNLEVIACIPGVHLVRFPWYAESEE